VPTPANPVVSEICPRVVNFLTNNPLGQAFAHLQGGVNQALQAFVVSGKDFSPTLLFLMAFATIMFGCVNAIREIVKEAPIYKRERAVNLGIIPYMFSKIVVLGVLCLLQTWILMAFVSIFDPFRHSIFLPPFLEIYITLALTSLAGMMLGLAVSALAPNNDRAAGLVPLLLLPQVIFAGAVFPLTSYFLQTVGMLFPVRWANAALDSTVGLHSDRINGDEIFGSSPSSHGTLYSIYSASQSLQYLLLMWLALVIILLVLGVAVGFFLKRKDSRG
jgi:ABC transport system ATP-binding/permease protein